MNTRMVRLFQFTSAQAETARPKVNAAHTPASKKVEAKAASDFHAKSGVATLVEEMPPQQPTRVRTAEQTSNSSGTISRTPAAKTERRHRRRVKISAPVRVRQVNCAHGSDCDVTMTIDVSREGVLFESARASYTRGQEVAVVFPYRPVPGEKPVEQRGQVVRVARASEKRYSVAVAFIEGEPTYELVDSLGRPFANEAVRLKTPQAHANTQHEKQLIVLVDADERQRRMLRAELEMQEYAVADMEEPNSAMSVLRHRTPAAIICESENFPGTHHVHGEMSGYDFCVVVRRNARFVRVPIILTTRTGQPSDFSTAHALGATVCVAKPYEMERFVNLLRMLAPAHAVS
ncbi:MAG TPA: response regulator [Candidatus Acidoferrales bacterium]|nr:response regulator [Candidatus Acidoferrales bacterium]